MRSIVKSNYLEILKTFFIALLFLALGAFIGVKFIPASFRYFLNIAFFILVLISAFSRRSGFVRNKISMNIYGCFLCFWSANCLSTIIYCIRKCKNIVILSFTKKNTIISTFNLYYATIYGK